MIYESPYASVANQSIKISKEEALNIALSEAKQHLTNRVIEFNQESDGVAKYLPSDEMEMCDAEALGLVEMIQPSNEEFMITVDIDDLVPFAEVHVYKDKLVWHIEYKGITNNKNIVLGIMINIDALTGEVIYVLGTV